MTLQDLLRADQLGIRLEVMNGLSIWEAMPLYGHQKHVERIAGSVRRAADVVDCQCVHAIDVYVQFRDGLKRPDVSIFCREPTEAEAAQALTLIPEAVVEVVSKGYEAKDLQFAPNFYLSQGVKDVLVFDPATLLVLHATPDRTERLVSPVTRRLACGCEVTV